MTGVIITCIIVTMLITIIGLFPLIDWHKLDPPNDQAMEDAWRINEISNAAREEMFREAQRQRWGRDE
jgi:uncharacterized membrane protein (DUF106 family)